MFGLRAPLYFVYGAFQALLPTLVPPQSVTAHSLYSWRSG